MIAVGAPETVRADVRVKGQTLFTLEKTARVVDERRAHVRSVYRDRAGRVALIMEAELVAGRPVRVRADDRQSGRRGEVRVKPGKVEFVRTDRDGEEERASSEVLGVVLVGPGLTGYIQSDEAWRRLERDEPVPIQIAAWEQLDTYGFELRRAEADDPNQLVVIMRPSSWVVRAFVEKMRYVFDRRTRRLLRYSGPVGVKRLDADGDLAAIEAEVVYTPRLEPAKVARNPACAGGAGLACAP